jgi:hypothetical protein
VIAQHLLVNIELNDARKVVEYSGAKRFLEWMCIV